MRPTDPEILARALATERAAAAERIETVRRLRDELAAVDATVEAAERAFFASIQTDTDRQHALTAALALAEQEARAIALDIYYADPSSKKPVAGASIRVKQSVTYSATEALAWAKQKQMFLVPEMLDAKALDKFLLNNAAEIGLGYTITETPTVALDKELPTPTEATA